MFVSCMTATAEWQPLWPGEAPGGAKPVVIQESEGEGGRLTDIAVPQYEVYLPEASRRSGAAVVILPGGGYTILAASHEGRDYADLAQRTRNRRGRGEIPRERQGRGRLPVSRAAAGRAPGDPGDPLPGEGMGRGSGEGRRHGILGRRPSGIDVRDPVGREISEEKARTRSIRKNAGRISRSWSIR